MKAFRSIVCICVVGISFGASVLFFRMEVGFGWTCLELDFAVVEAAADFCYLSDTLRRVIALILLLYRVVFSRVTVGMVFCLFCLAIMKLSSS